MFAGSIFPKTGAFLIQTTHPKRFKIIDGVPVEILPTLKAEGPEGPTEIPNPEYFTPSKERREEDESN